MENNILDNVHIEIISPQNKSRYEYINDESVVGLCAFLLKNMGFMVYVGSIIDECTNVNKLIASKSLKEFYSENYGDDLEQEKLEKNNEFIDLIFSLYSTHPESGIISNIRGSILERLTLLLILDRYMYDNGNVFLPIKKDSLLNNCQLDLDCKVRVNYANWITKDPIDIAGWDQANLTGEVYECKVKISGMKQSDDEILHDLCNICESSSYISAFRVGVVTFSNIEGYEYYFEYIQDQNKVDSKVKLYGRNNLKELSGKVKRTA